MREDWTFKEHAENFEEMLVQRQPWDEEASEIEEFIAPGMAVLDYNKNPRYKRFNSTKVVNPIVKKASKKLIAEVFARMTSPARPWFKPQLELVEPQDEVERPEILDEFSEITQWHMMAAFRDSNFYQTMLSFYFSQMQFGTGVVFSGSTTDKDIPVYFENLTWGEYVLGLTRKDEIDVIYRAIYMTPKSIVEEFGEENLSSYVLDRKTKTSEYLIILEYTGLEDNGKVVQKFYEYGQPGSNSPKAIYGGTFEPADREPLKVNTFPEMPYFVNWWEKLSGEVYGTGLGTEALPVVKKLQEMEKSLLMATHRESDPPITVSNHMYQRLDKLPGGVTVRHNPDDKAEKLYDFRFDYNGVGMNVERYERAIQRIYFNDLFFTGVRDPNATPYKATEVMARDREKMTELGPVSMGLSQVFNKLIPRVFNILWRKNIIPNVDLPRTAINIEYIGPLAMAQKLVALESYENFIMAAGNIGGIKPESIDKVDGDSILEEFADVTGVSSVVLIPQERVDEKREGDAEMKKMQMQMQMQMMNLEMAGKQAEIGEKRSKTASNVSDIRQEQGYGTI